MDSWGGEIARRWLYWENNAVIWRSPMCIASETWSHISLRTNRQFDTAPYVIVRVEINLAWDRRKVRRAVGPGCRSPCEFVICARTEPNIRYRSTPEPIRSRHSHRPTSSSYTSTKWLQKRPPTSTSSLLHGMLAFELPGLRDSDVSY